jgi:hypothetical protein
MKEPAKPSVSARTDTPQPAVSSQRSAMQERLRAETANFDFATLLHGISPTEANPPAASPHGPPSRYGLRHFVGMGALAVVSAGIVFATIRGHNPPGSKAEQNWLASAQVIPAAPLPQAPIPAQTDEAVTSMGDTAQVRSLSLRTGTMRLHISRALTGPFSYWFVAATEQASAPQTLPPQDTRGRVDLTIPAAYNHAGAQVRLLDQSLGKVARLPVTDFSRPDVVVEPQVGANVLRDEKSADVAQAWTLEKSGPSAQGTLQRRDALEGPAGITGRVLRLEVSALGTQNWNVQCYQAGVNLQEGKIYQFAFWAKSDRARQLSVSAILDKPNWNTLGLSGSVALTPDWQKYVVPFTARHCVPHHGRVSFLLGDALGTVGLAGITLREGTGRSVSRPRASNSAVEVTLPDFQ